MILAFLQLFETCIVYINPKTIIVVTILTVYVPTNNKYLIFLQIVLFKPILK